jgi:hypothetical protein
VNANLRLGVNIDNILNETYRPNLYSDNAEGLNAKFTVSMRLGG